ncbi:AraC family transcriptional regulator [Rossellomorea yichunensis]|uniref:AraC family transcriptional regulator n=1 Tax=Rossellomorea yichunensis TaxID=3077331 RepID=UPI0028DFB353|nr:AraC family transcriptional regulator [Rossellomorea sp. YC4-1]MDT9027025.1 AraC family transcriptional regulator [Rossellomorea sp. YC4-1]
MPQDKIQRNQIDKVVEYIDQHLSEDLSLEQLAKVSTYSPYHFQRLFKGLIGETPAEKDALGKCSAYAHLRATASYHTNCVHMWFFIVILFHLFF